MTTRAKAIATLPLASVLLASTAALADSRPAGTRSEPSIVIAQAATTEEQKKKKQQQQQQQQQQQKKAAPPPPPPQKQVSPPPPPPKQVPQRAAPQPPPQQPSKVVTPPPPPPPPKVVTPPPAIIKQTPPNYVPPKGSAGGSGTPTIISTPPPGGSVPPIPPGKGKGPAGGSGTPTIISTPPPGGSVPPIPPVKGKGPGSTTPANVVTPQPGLTPGKPGVLVPPPVVAPGGGAGVQPVTKAPVIVEQPSNRLKDVQRDRRERVEDQGRRIVIREVDRRTIVRQDNRVVIHHDDSSRFRRFDPNIRVERRNDGSIYNFIARPGGDIVSVYDRNGRLVRRYRRGPGGSEIVLIDNRRHLVAGVIGFMVGAAIVSLARPVITIPRERYIVSYRDQPEDYLYETLIAPPIERLERRYSYEEVIQSPSLRERMRRIDLETITFESGDWQVSPDQYPKLERIARAILRVIDRNPNEVFLIEGHTDAVGSDVDNLTLSDRRAEAVATILTEQFRIPPENMTSQGYGEQFLKVDTDEAARSNRRVTIRRITPLLNGEG